MRNIIFLISFLFIYKYNAQKIAGYQGKRFFIEANIDFPVIHNFWALTFNKDLNLQLPKSISINYAYSRKLSLGFNFSFFEMKNNSVKIHDIVFSTEPSRFDYNPFKSRATVFGLNLKWFRKGFVSPIGKSLSLSLNVINSRHGVGKDSLEYLIENPEYREWNNEPEFLTKNIQSFSQINILLRFGIENRVLIKSSPFYIMNGFNFGANLGGIVGRNSPFIGEIIREEESYEEKKAVANDIKESHSIDLTRVFLVQFQFGAGIVF